MPFPLRRIGKRYPHRTCHRRRLALQWVALFALTLAVISFELKARFSTVEGTSVREGSLKSQQHSDATNSQSRQQQQPPLKEDPVTSSMDDSSATKPKNCTLDQTNTIRQQLPPSEHCNNSQLAGKKCSITNATNCPEATWLDDYYRTITSIQEDFFLALNVGCNKGMDAIHYLRMGTRDPAVQKAVWRDALFQSTTSRAKMQGVCKQLNAPDASLPNTSSSKTVPGQVHCIEPMPFNTGPLFRALNISNYASKGLVVAPVGMSNVEAEMAIEAESVPFGFEAMSLGNAKKRARKRCKRKACQTVPITTLDAYYEANLSPRRQAIHVLAIDTEGSDYNVLKGGRQNVLPRTHYLEFEHHHFPPWNSQSLEEAIEFLNAEFEFTCYWAGKGYLWRITSCWIYKDLEHKWSNVACVNRKLAPDLAVQMERVFERTLEEPNLVF